MANQVPQSNREYINAQTKNWTKYIKNLDFVFKELEKKTIISLGVVPYSRIVLGLFLKNYILFCSRYCQDIELIRKWMQVYCVEEHNKKITEKIQGTGYLLKNFTFQNFLKRLSRPYTLLFYQVTAFIQQALEEQNIPYIGNQIKSQSRVLVKYEFRQLVKELGLPHIEDYHLSRADFLASSYEGIYKIFNGSFVCQRGDLDCGGELATFFVHTKQNFEKTQQILAKDERFSIVEINPFIKGETCTMIGCATKHGVFCGPLQTQLIDVPESLGRYEGRGVFCGHDFGLKNWQPEAETQAINIVKTLGKYLYQNGYKGIFGIDLIYDEAKNQIYPLECNPRFTGSFPMLPLFAMQAGLPPFDLLHTIEHLNIKADYNFEKLDQDYQFKSSYSHILIIVTGVKEMPVQMPVGIYRYNGTGDDVLADDISFERPGLLPWEIKNDNEFLVVDSVFNKGALISKDLHMTKLVRIIFPVSIAKNSYQLKPRFAKITKIFSELLHAN